MWIHKYEYEDFKYFRKDIGNDVDNKYNIRTGVRRAGHSELLQCVYPIIIGAIDNETVDCKYEIKNRIFRLYPRGI
jgi:hypothetical protein